MLDEFLEVPPALKLHPFADDPPPPPLDWELLEKTILSTALSRIA